MNEGISTRPRISLRTYQGIGHDFIELSASKADGFMRVADMRADISIVSTKKPKPSPSLDGRSWSVPVNDEKLMEKAFSGRKDGQSVEEVFHRLFRKQVLNGIDDCLGQEKTSNVGGDKMTTYVSYMALAGCDLWLPYNGVIGAMKHGNGLEIAAAVIAMMAIFNAGVNMVNEISAVHGGASNPDQPFVRHSLMEKVLPPVPLDRFVRGQLYLVMHGKSMFQLKP